MGSSSELGYLIFLSKELELIKKSTFIEFESKIIEIKKVLTSLMKKLRAEI